MIQITAVQITAVQITAVQITVAQMDNRQKLITAFKKFIETQEPSLGADRDFLIQHTVFKKEGDEWLMYCTIPGTANFGLNMIQVKYTDGGMKIVEPCVEIASWKGDYESFEISEFSQKKGKSDWKTKVYAVDLYRDFKYRKFGGWAYTRGPWTSIRQV